jgi:dTMP kinase
MTQDFGKKVRGGLFITIEGIHGCGKSTQIELLDKKLKGQGFKPVLTKEVAGTPIADEIYKLAFKEGGEAFGNPLLMTLLIATSRASRVDKIIKPVVQKGGVVLADRYEGSMIVFQHYCQGVDLKLINLLNKHITQGVHANITFVIDLDPKIALIRKRTSLKVGEKLTGWDARKLQFHRKSRLAYQNLCKSQKNWILLDGRQTAQELSEVIFSKVIESINRKNAK